MAGKVDTVYCRYILYTLYRNISIIEYLGSHLTFDYTDTKRYVLSHVTYRDSIYYVSFADFSRSKQIFIEPTNQNLLEI